MIVLWFWQRQDLLISECKLKCCHCVKVQNIEVGQVLQTCWIPCCAITKTALFLFVREVILMLVSYNLTTLSFFILKAADGPVYLCCLTSLPAKAQLFMQGAWLKTEQCALWLLEQLCSSGTCGFRLTVVLVLIGAGVAAWACVLCNRAHLHPAARHLPLAVGKLQRSVSAAQAACRPCRPGCSCLWIKVEVRNRLDLLAAFQLLLLCRVCILLPTPARLGSQVLAAN